MVNTWDVIVVGLGAMGSATLHQLARRGQHVLGIEQFTPGHANGSSHGKSRIIREAYFEDPRYVPLVQRAYECWRELESDSGATVFRQTGGLMLGAPDCEVVTGARRSAELHGLPHEVIDAAEVRRRYPAFHPAEHEIGVVEPRAGMLAPELAITTFVARARQHGAQVRTGEAFVSWRSSGDGVEVTTTKGTYLTARLILTVGAWAGKHFAELAIPFTVQRNVLHWFTPLRHAEYFTPERFPIFIHEHGDGPAWYGFPDTGDGVKLALHHHGDITDPDALRGTVRDDEVELVRAIMRRCMPDADGPLLASEPCMYTNVPDDHFVIDHHPSHPSVIIASPCSGHGFKFASALGEVLADMATGDPIAFDTSLFSLARFTRVADANATIPAGD
jgi:sarcosine oxidase